MAKGRGVITHIEISGFKSLEKVSLDLGGLNILVGTNASGKSNFFDALRVLQGIGYGLTIGEIFDGKPKGPGTEVWEGIRGGIENAVFREWSAEGNAFIRLAVRLRCPALEPDLRYEIVIFPKRALVRMETLGSGEAPIFHVSAPTADFDLARPILQQFAKSKQCTEQDAELIETCSRLMSDTQLLDPSPAFLRGYSTSQTVGRMGERGENFAGLVKSILGDERNRAAYESWLKQLTPAELDKVVVMEGALREPLFAVKKNGHRIPAPLLSDGTLRFAALAAAFFQPDMPQTLLVEEIENGIHPTRLRLLIELLKSRTAGGRPQVMATSHSPLVLAWLTEEDYKTTFYCKKDEETGASTITPLSEIPRFTELARKQPAADLFAEGWLETAI
ncbi:putative ATPase [Candidatus Sulfopaludibacter sp. SbA4]|nr:putative ATPase [Candidatus Sulfopaludibacter sp. SbA4]